MSKTQIENRNQIRFDCVDGQWKFSVYGPKASPQETGGHVFDSQNYPSFDEAVSAFKAKYDAG
jgi:hypothetical protein